MSEIINNIIDLTANAGGAVINNQNITVTENGIYTADADHTGLGTVGVNVLTYPDFRIVGNLTRNKYSFSNFSQSDYIKNSINFSPENYSWEIGLGFTLNSVSAGALLSSRDNNKNQIALDINEGHFSYYLSSNNSTYDILGGAGSVILETNTRYFAKLIYDNINKLYKILYSTDKINWSTDFETESNLLLASSNMPFTFGVFENSGTKWSPFDGVIHMEDCYIKINNEIIWQAASYD